MQFTIIFTVISFFNFIYAAPIGYLGARDSALSGTRIGRGTFFGVGLGACGWHNTDSDFIVALNQPLFERFGNNAICSKIVNIRAANKPNSPTVRATIVDECPGCGSGDLDMSPTLFKKFASLDQGIVKISWEITDEVDGSKGKSVSQSGGGGGGNNNGSKGSNNDSNTTKNDGSTQTFKTINHKTIGGHTIQTHPTQTHSSTNAPQHTPVLSGKHPRCEDGALRRRRLRARVNQDKIDSALSIVLSCPVHEHTDTPCTFHVLSIIGTDHSAVWHYLLLRVVQQRPQPTRLTLAIKLQDQNYFPRIW
ncbi:hypothetical protein ABKN59_010775 [Abortiporus biennis]